MHSNLYKLAIKSVPRIIALKFQMDLSMKTKVIVGKLLGVQKDNNSDNGNRPIYQISTAI
jgi:hypothetical protein